MLHAMFNFPAAFLVFLSIPIVHCSPEDSFASNAAQELVIVAKGQLGSVTLSDSSTVMLDAGSEISYPKTFSQNTREVTVSGEAFFNVVGDSSRPFIVHAENSVIKAPGGTFNVRAWKGMKEVNVVVVEGTVAMKEETQSDASSVVVSKGKMSVVTEKNKKPTTPISVDVEKQTAWMRRELILENAPLSEVIERLQRWYDLTIETPSPLYGSTRITGVFPSKNVDKSLQEIGLIINLEVERDGNKVSFVKRR